MPDLEWVEDVDAGPGFAVHLRAPEAKAALCGSEPVGRWRAVGREPLPEVWRMRQCLACIRASHYAELSTGREPAQVRRRAKQGQQLSLV